MIPYEELVAALARWRARKGLPTGVADFLGESSGPSLGHPAPPPVIRYDHASDDVVELGDELLDGVMEESEANPYEDPTGLSEGVAAYASDVHDLHDEPIEAAELGPFDLPAASYATDAVEEEVAPEPPAPEPDKARVGRGRVRNRRR